MNQVNLIGNLGADPEYRTTQKGNPAVRFRLATNTGYGEYKRTDWHSIECFSKTADIVNAYCKAGSKVRVTGEIQYNKVEKEDGTSVTYTNIIGREVELLDKKGDNEHSAAGAAFSDNDVPF